MGFRQNGFCSVWSVEPSRTGKTTRVRLSSSRKNKMTDEWEQDFSGFCTFIGDAHNMAQNLRPKDRIKILECDVGTTYDKEKQKEYVNYKVFSFEMANGSSSGSSESKPASKPSGKRAPIAADDGDTGELDEDSNLPF